MPPVISSVWMPRSFLSSRYMPSAADTVPTPIWIVSPSLTSSAATSVQITSTAATSSSLSAAAGVPPLGASASTTTSSRSMWTWFSPPVRMKSSWTSAMTSSALRDSVPESHTPGPKLHQPMTVRRRDRHEEHVGSRGEAVGHGVGLPQPDRAGTRPSPAWTAARLNGVA